MLVKTAKDLKFGDIIIYNTEKFVISKYEQYSGMGHFDWGDYGRLYVTHIKNPKVPLGYPGLPDSIQTYRNHPFIVWSEAT